MNWIELTIDTTEEGTEAVIAALDTLGITQVCIIQGNDEINEILRTTEKYWDYADESVLNQQPAVQAYIAETTPNPDRNPMVKSVYHLMTELKALESRLGVALGTLDIHKRIICEEDWANNWKAYFKPVPVGEKLLICPSWEEVPADNERAVLKIDPGMAFGTGTHHTTRMCLELLESNIHEGDMVADLGCGSGILSIAASLMGASAVYAVDIDPVATKVAAENAGMNQIDMSRYIIRTGDILSDATLKDEIGEKKYDIVLANIVANVIIALAPIIPKLMKDTGILIASGIIEDRLDEVVEVLKNNGMTVKEIRSGEDWRALIAVKA